MKKQKKQFLSATLIAMLFGLTATAQAASINERQANQRDRIKQGVSSGELTRVEAKRLINQQKKIARKEAHFKSDGEFTRRERAILQHDLSHSSGAIYRQKHDQQSR